MFNNFDSHSKYLVPDFDNVYVNVFFNNFTQGNLSNVINASFNQTKDNYMVTESKKYYLTVVRGEFPLDSLPILFCPIVPNQANPNLTTFQVRVDNTTQNVIYVPDNLLVPPVQNSTLQVITDYYAIYSVTQLLNMINTAISTACGTAGVVDIPRYLFDPKTNLISLIVPNGFVTGNHNLYINYDLLSYLPNFRYFSESENLFRYILTDTTSYYPSDNYGVYNNAGTFRTFEQQLVSIVDWFVMRRILVVSSSFPINFETVPVLVKSGNTISYSSQNLSFPIIADFVLQIESFTKNVAYYVPFQYRLIDIVSNQSLKELNLSIFWEDKFGNVYPLPISRNAQAALKIGFLNKKLFLKS